MIKKIDLAPYTDSDKYRHDFRQTVGDFLGLHDIIITNQLKQNVVTKSLVSIFALIIILVINFGKNGHSN